MNNWQNLQSVVNLARTTTAKENPLFCYLETVGSLSLCFADGFCPQETTHWILFPLQTNMTMTRTRILRFHLHPLPLLPCHPVLLTRPWPAPIDSFVHWSCCCVGYEFDLRHSGPRLIGTKPQSCWTMTLPCCWVIEDTMISPASCDDYHSEHC